MEHYKNASLENLVMEFEGVLYTELWMPITQPFDYKGKYQISSFGRIKRSKRYIGYRKSWLPEKILIISSGRYLRFNRKKKTTSVHKLVGLHFIPNPEMKPQLNHKDLIKWNNFFKNLEWCTQSENIVHGQINGVFPFAKPKPALKLKHEKNCKGGFFKPIIDLNTGIFYTSDELANIIGMERRYISRMLNEERKSNTTQFRYA